MVGVIAAAVAVNLAVLVEQLSWYGTKTSGYPLR